MSAQALVAVEVERPRSNASRAVGRFWNHKLAVAGLFVVLAVSLLAVFAPQLSPYPLGQPDPLHMLAAPSWRHLMGTDEIGADLFTEVLYGARISLMVGFTSAAVAVGLGGVVGAVAGYVGGIVDSFLMRVVDMALAIPLLFLVLVLSVIIGPSPATIVLIIGGTSWMYPARIMRSQVLTLKTREFVEAARAGGASASRIVARHIAPNAIAALIVNATLLVGQAIVLESVVSFLGAGVQPPFISWGYLLNTSQTYILSDPWLGFFPGAMIFLVVLSVNLVGDGLRDALEP